ncbi:MAG: HAD-IC family P-type ATPase [Syntrophomonadaceae bacterium]|nr:HAD-IC family P-type ATPase [Syntrophomonadaceae bacterium]
MEKQLSTDEALGQRWHACEVNSIFLHFGSGPDGLEEEQAALRLKEIGPNALPEVQPPAIWQVLLHQVKNPLIYILIAAAVASAFIGDFKDAFFIMIVIVLNSGLGAYQEFSAEKSAASLQNLLKIRARVRRSGREYEIPSEELVPGDLVMLESGIKVPADLRLIEASNLTADESFLTGESNAATKNTGLLPEDTGVSDLTNMTFAGSTIMTGRGKGIVVSTGLRTEVGKIAQHVAESESGKPPLVMRMERFTKQISYLVLVISLFLVTLLYMQGLPGTAIFFFVVALAVSAIPEGLPVALTVALSVAVSRMSKRNVIVRKLPAVESLGSCTVIASDKTGTLTVNQQTVRQILLPSGYAVGISGEGYNGIGEISALDQIEIPAHVRLQLENMLKLAMIANEGSLSQRDGKWAYYGDAMDVALLAAGYKSGLSPERLKKEYRLLDMIPYESERKFAAAFYQQGDQVFAAAKGAVETIVEFCDHMQYGEQLVPIDRLEVEKQAEAKAALGYRVLAIAGAAHPDFMPKDLYSDQDLPRMVLYGLVGFIDPLRPEAIEAVNKCKTAGIRVLMITGDHKLTARAIACELGIAEEDDNVVTGQQLMETGSPDSQDFADLVASSRVFARVSPTQKLEIVEVLIKQGEFVAVTGDGVNDVPALRRANIGVAMGSGTDVAKETSAMIVTDDNFSSIVAGVEEGRFAYDNVRKVTYLLISTGAAEVALFTAAILAQLPLPLLAVQILWLNLVTNGIQDVALAFEGGEPGAMQRKPRGTDEKIFNNKMIVQTLISGLTMGVIAFATWFVLIKVQLMDEHHARNVILLLMVLMQNVHVFNCRSEFTSAFRVPIRRNYLLILGVIVAQGIHLLSMHLPFMQQVLGTEPVLAAEWIAALVLALSLLLVMELYKKYAQ